VKTATLKRIPRRAEPGGSEAVRVGEELRDARLALGYSVEEMAARLRIRRAYLDALEEGRTGELPGLAYVLGFVRSYATALGLDAEEMARRYRDLPGAGAVRPKLVFPEPVPERGLPMGRVAAVGAVAAVLGYVAWFNMSGAGDRAVDVVPPVPPRLEAAADQGRSQLGGRSEAGALPLAALPPPGGLPPLLPAPGANTAAQAATVPAAPTAIAAAAPPPTPAPAAAVAAPPAPAIPGVPDGTRIVLRARVGMPEGAWVQVRDTRSGAVVVSRVLRPGEVWPAPLRDGLVLDTGKADGLEILVDGQPSPFLDGQVGVRRNIALDPERLRSRVSAPTAAAGTSAPRN
jgi:cytoskeleton protein RodZ